MIELNLLPDVKLEYIKAQKTRRLFIGVSSIVAVVSVIMLVVLLLVGGLQKKHLSDLASDISTQSATLKNEAQINKILTVQNQLESLSTLHAGKPEASQLFTYINQVTPARVSINDLTIDFTKDTISVTGSTDTLSSVNQYVDTLKLATYTTNKDQTAKAAFNSVVLSSFSLNASGDPSTAASYSINFNYDPAIFDITASAKLSVTTTTTTHGSLTSPTDLFKSTDKRSAANGQ